LWWRNHQLWSLSFQHESIAADKHTDSTHSDDANEFSHAGPRNRHAVALADSHDEHGGGVYVRRDASGE
jgi:hypothetical protein